ncbi:uncharacterized protein LAESUDRAFT_760899 [Laetiporus sulphureus 93-53]|uniref:DUF7082 domain-containing protein n=1 Tax=Laetiporus sulphureus 93-53 TaxID=1314785 RepID=A0A165DD65_9APHY|nr:uncharacterized protein LAESUDRAFT_760899 [Laetiporus sulphureus 93-53]KZT04605.1 hypothetical protein LAESUDRAFT_760899 [Laetiporus sulphureus 93-53]
MHRYPIAPRYPPRDDTRYIDSPQGTLRIYGYEPHEGVPGTVLTVTLDFLSVARIPTQLRLVLGRAALPTTVEKVAGGQHTFQLQATVPDDARVILPPTVSLHAQTLDTHNTVLDSVAFGNFTCINLAPSNRHMRPYPDTHDSILGLPMSPDAPRSPNRKARYSTQSSPSRSSLPHRHTHHARVHAPSARPVASFISYASPCGDERLHGMAANLELLTPLESMSKDWDEDEYTACRRLVRFQKEREGNTIKVSCTVIKQHEYIEGGMVISCIYRRETNSCYVTSVDVIFLLERLVDNQFDVETKNRIRRNLERFHPQTVSKNRASTSEFFSLIMNLPAPKPRNIEKDLKVFEWKVLSEALHKMVSRLTLPYIPAQAEPIPTLQPRISPSPSLLLGQDAKLSPSLSCTSSEFSPASIPAIPSLEYPASPYNHSVGSPSSFVSQMEYTPPSLASDGSPAVEESAVFGSAVSTPIIATPPSSDPSGVPYFTLAHDGHANAHSAQFPQYMPFQISEYWQSSCVAPGFTSGGEQPSHDSKSVGRAYNYVDAYPSTF